MNKETTLSLAQQDVYYEHIMKPESALYNTGGYIVFNGAFDQAQFKTIVEGCSKAFDIYDIKFDFTGEEPLQYLRDTTRPVVINDLDLSSAKAPEVAAKDWMKNQFNIAFDLNQGDLYRFTLIKVTETQHILYGCFHHLIVDGFGFAILANFWVDQYKQFLAGDLSGAPSSEVAYPSYLDAVQRSNDYLTSGQYEKDAVYWKDKFENTPDLILHQKKQKEDSGHSYSIAVSEADSQLLSRICERSKVNVSQLTIAALLIYFGKTTSQEEFSFGLPMHKRSGREERKTVGMFSGVLPFKGEFSAAKRLSELLADIRQLQRDDFRHGLYPISHLNRSLKLLSENRLQLFDIIINYILLPFPDSVSEDLSVQIKELRSTTDLGAPLTIRWVDYGKNSVSELNFDYQESYFNEREIELLADRLLFILRQFADSLDQSVQDIAIVPREETTQLLEVFNDTAVSYPDKNLIDLFEAQAAKTPESIAVADGGNTHTYKVLDERSNQLAHYLAQQGVSTDQLVGICLGRGLEMVVGILGILKAGGAYVPIDPEYPENRIAYMLADSDVDLVLCTDASRPALDAFEGFTAVHLDSDWESIATYPAKKVAQLIDRSDLAYVMYTSGSTGKPKGVMMPHGPLYNLVSFDYQLGISSQRVGQFTSMSFDVSFLEIFFTITQGGALHIIPSTLKSDLEGLTAFISDHAIQTVFFPTSFFHFMGAEGVLEELHSLEHIIVAGEQLRLSQTAKKGLDRIGATLHNHYGPTEAHVVTTKKVDYNVKNINDELVSIGKPIANTQIYVVNNDLEVVPTGTAGELCIGGDCVARGYWNKVQLTKEKFVDNPFREGGRLYKTGDLAKWLPDGNIEFIGRKDDQVKVRGYRIELGEIENALSQLSGVNQCCVLAKADNTGNKRLVAYVVTEGEMDKEALQALLTEGLPEYMVPRIWVSMEEMRLTSNGKLDKKALPDLDISALSNKAYVAPRTDLEIQLAEVWQELLNVEKVGVYDNFFELGGHSLLATRLVATIRKELDIEIAIRDVFTYATIDALGVYLSEQSKGTLLSRISKVEQRPAKIPLSFSQESLWFIDQLQGSLEYHLPFVLKLSGELDTEALSAGFQQVVSRHEVLRTVIHSEDGVAWQQLLPAEEWKIFVKDLSVDRSSLTEELKTFLQAPFDLSADYMFRACLYDMGVNAGGEQEYMLAGAFHHIASDGWSLGIVVREFIESYHTLVAGESINLSPLPFQYADYALWQRNNLEGTVIEGELDYWEEKMAGVTALQLPTDHVRPAVQSIAGATGSFELSDALSADINALSQREGVTVFMTLLAAFKVLMSRYSGQEEVCIGSPIANRTQKDLEGMIGFFVNTLALRTQVTPESTFQELLQAVKKTTLEAYEHQHVPFEKVVDRVVQTRDLSMSPLFQVMFVLQNTPEAVDIALDGLTISEYEDHELTAAKYDITFTVNETDDRFAIEINYCTDLFEEATIDRMFAHYQELLTAVVATPSSKIVDISMLPEDEKQHLLEVFNDTTARYAMDKTVVDLFKEQAAKTPSAIAVVCEDNFLTYKELDEKSDRLAQFLKTTHHLEKEDVVGILLDRSLWSVVSILGILKSGACYLPIDKTYPDSRKEFIITDAAVKLLIVESGDLSAVKGDEVPVFPIDTELDQLKIDTEQVLSKPTPRNLAYIIYTSGSTGNPKGVMVEHRHLVNYLSYGIQHYKAGTGGFNFPLFTSLAFDLTQTSIYLTLLTGGALHVYRSQDVSTVFKDLTSRKSITCIKLTPAHLPFLKDLDLSGILSFIIGGEQLTHADLDNLGALHPTARIFNEYGPTEATIGCVVAEVTDYQSIDKITIGQPIANTQIYIVNDHAHLVPVGVVGELCIGGAQVTRGYLNREELTKEKFIANPLGTGGRIYRTGDLARWLPDGNIEFLGRKDDQVKVRGYRIELGEIESNLSSLSGVNQCCVLANADSDGNNRLVAYVVPDGDFDKDGLEEQLIDRLPDYMVPKLWVQLEEIPLTANGKLDRKALPALDGATLSHTEYIAPQTDTEVQLATIWQDLLGVAKAGIHDNFFGLGGHSLLAIRLVALIRNEMGIEIAIRDVFTHPTIAGMSAYLDRQEKGTLLPKVRRIEQPPAQIPLSFSQERLWFMDQLHGSLEYHLPFAIRLTGKLDKEALSLSLRQVVNRHEVLRSVIYSEKGVGYQNLLSADDWELSYRDLTGDNAVLNDDLKSFLLTPFNLDEDYMFRACLYDLGTNDYLLAGVFHHIASDGWSRGILASEFMQLYRAYASGEEADLLPLPLQYTDYALWQRNHLAGAIVDQQLSYWERQLAGIDALQLPIDYARPAVQSVAGANLRFTLSAALSSAVKSLSQQEEVTAFMTLLSAFKVLLSKYSGQEDICVGTPVANRMQKELEGMIGFFVNTLALRTQVSAGNSFKEILQAVKQTTLDAYDHQQAPFEKVVERVVKTRDMSMSPLFQVVFALQNTPESAAIEMDGLAVTDYPHQEQVTSKFDISMTLEETENGFEIDVNYCTDLFKEETIQRMLVHYQELLSAIVAAPAAQLSDLSMLNEEEKHQLLTVFNDTSASYPTDRTVVDLFEEQARNRPEAIAVKFEGQALTYQELDARSNQLAHYLVEKGVSVQDLVGVCLDRGPELIISILAIMKSGGVYLPIDPANPAERIRYMIEDASINLLISNNAVADRIPDRQAVEVILLEEAATAIERKSIEALSVELTVDNLAYVIYTSGSTGKPKGVLIEHGGICNTIQGQISVFSITSEDNCLQYASPSFDASIWEILLSLLSGATLCIIAESKKYELSYFPDFVADQEISFAILPPAFLQLLDVAQIPGIRTLVTGGDEAPLRNAQLFSQTGNYFNAYGPTEASICTTVFNGEINGFVPIGSPVPNTAVYLLNESSELVPTGVVGELCIGGLGLARGYLNQEALTAEKFVANPFRPGERMYKTGDLARWLPDGNLAFVGRKDTQVKIRGYRIELGEIENTVAAIPGIQQCCVVARLDDDRNNRLISYVVADGELEKEALESKLLESLPKYMVPRLWVPVDAMPLTASGKIDRKSLPEPEHFGLSSQEYVAPETDMQAQLAEIWQDLLGIDQVGIYDNFFELGGHSLLAVRQIAGIQEIGYTLNVQDIFSNPTVAALSTKLSKLADGHQVPANGIQPGCAYITPSMVSLVNVSQQELESIMDACPGGGANIQDIYPLSPLQEGIYFHHLMGDRSKGDPYVIPNILSFSTSAERSEFIKALEFVIARHDVLRTLVLSDGLPQALQVVLRSVDLSVTDIAIDESHEVLPQVEKEVAPEYLWVDPARAPMLQAKVADDAANEVYYLALSHHHLVMDHVGLARVGEEIKAYLSGLADTLPTPSLYRDFIGDTLDQGKIEGSKQYFSDLYQSVEEPTYPFNLSDTNVDGATSILSSSAILSPALCDRVRKVSGEWKMSPAVLFHAAFGLVIGRTSNTDYALFGSVLLGRLQGSKGSDSSLGLFMNTLPILLDLTSDVAAYVNLTKERLQGLLSYEQTPLARVHQWSGISNEVPLFSALLNYRHSSADAISDNPFGLGLKSVTGDERTNYPFNFSIDDFGDDFWLTAKLSDTGIEPEVVITYMEEALSALLDGMAVEGASMPLTDVSILSKAEEHQLLEVFNDTVANYPTDQTIVDLFEARVSKMPEAIAVVYEGQTFSYQELDERSNQLAHHLVEKGVSVEDLVGVCLDRSPELIISILAILKAGGDYVPIDPSYQSDRINYMIDDAAIDLLISTKAVADRIPYAAVEEVVLLDTASELIGSKPVSPLSVELSVAHLAYVIYTSGSTGKPKGVLIEHGGICNTIQGQISLFGLSDADNCLQYASPSFDASMWETLLSLLSGATLCIIGESKKYDIAYFVRYAEEQSITFVTLPPAFFQLLDVDEIAGIETLVTAGDEAPLVNAQLFSEMGNYFNAYGPTETSICATIFNGVRETVAPIGSPIANATAYVLNESLDLVPTGVIGELCVGGRGLARGYLNQEALTKKQFIAHPFKEGERLYRTGDLARWLPDGNLEFIGRKDDQVKVRGYRIELGEIEQTLSLQKAVVQCCVLARADSNGNNRLIAYVVAEDGANMEVLQAQLQGSLPEYMIPQYWIALDEMPLTSSGKIDKKALRTLDNSVLSTNEYVAPRTTIEAQLAEIWQELLDADSVGVYDNFFELGGHSLLATRLVSAIRKELALEIDIRAVFTHTNIDSLATHLATQNQASTLPNVTRVEVRPEKVPLSFSQERLWFLDQLQGSLEYHIPFAVRLSGNLDEEALLRSLREVVNRHEVLRTVVINHCYLLKTGRSLPMI